jgi:hypothetical protein
MVNTTVSLAKDLAGTGICEAERQRHAAAAEGHWSTSASAARAPSRNAAPAER